MPSKIVFFAWKAWWGKVMTTKLLKRRNFRLADKCLFCGREEEELEYLLIHYPTIWSQWTDLLSVVEVPWVCPLLVRNHLNSWCFFPSKKKSRILWKVAHLFLFWALWKERNRIVFEGVFFSSQRIKS